MSNIWGGGGGVVFAASLWLFNCAHGESLGLASRQPGLERVLRAEKSQRTSIRTSSEAKLSLPTSIAERAKRAATKPLPALELSLRRVDIHFSDISIQQLKLQHTRATSHSVASSPAASQLTSSHLPSATSAIETTAVGSPRTTAQPSPSQLQYTIDGLG